jgi:tetratricopeptide (TPR) repeat protein
LKENTAAITAYQQALGIGRKIQVQSIIWKAEAGLARASQQDRPEQALLHFRRAIEAIENVRSRQLTSEERIDFFQNKTAVYQQTVLLLASLHRRDPSKRYDAEAFHMAERARSRALLDSLGETAAHMEQSLDRKLLDRQQEIQQRLSQVEAQMLKAAVDKTTPPDTLRKLEADLLQAVNEYSDWRRQVRLHDPRIADLTLPEPFTLQQVQEALRNGG